VRDDRGRHVRAVVVDWVIWHQYDTAEARLLAAHARVANCTNGLRVAELLCGVIADSNHGRPSLRAINRYVVLSLVNFTCSELAAVII
jgi:hypothetical protein